jgi:hypothetical protein
MVEGVAREIGVAVDAIPLEGDVIGTHIAFFKHPDIDPAPVSDFVSHPVQGPAIAEEEEDIDFAFDEDLFEERGPFFGATAEEDGVSWGKEPVAAVEIDFADLSAFPEEILGETFKERSDGALEEENPFIFKRSEAALDHNLFITPRPRGMSAPSARVKKVPRGFSRRSARSSASASSAVIKNPVLQLV